MEQLGSHWTDVHEILYVSIFLKSVENIQDTLRPDNCNGNFNIPTFMIIYRTDLLRLKNSSDMFVEKIDTHISYQIAFSRKSCCLRNNVEKFSISGQATGNNTIKRMLFMCWMNKATRTHKKYIIGRTFQKQIYNAYFLI